VKSAELKIYKALEEHLPSNTVDYCFGLWKKFPFDFRIKAPRKSKLGDYRYRPQTGSHQITINRDLNPYAFLITYLHEVAHLVTFDKYGRKTAPHGKEWKYVFGYILKPLCKPQVLPDDIQIAVKHYIKNPKAASCSDRQMTEVLGRYSESHKIFLKDIPAGELFTFQERIFRKGKIRRTRYVCDEVRSGKSYLISSHAEINPHPTSG
jgi:predicted SprT family Zn-dependent metalloprotease